MDARWIGRGRFRINIGAKTLVAKAARIAQIAAACWRAAQKQLAASAISGISISIAAWRAAWQGGRISAAGMASGRDMKGRWRVKQPLKGMKIRHENA